LLFPEMLSPVAHPDIASKLKPNDPDGILAYPLLHDSDLTGWRAWFDDLDVSLKPRAHDRRFEDYSLVLAGAESGLGIALARLPLATAWLQQSELVRLDRRTVTSPLAYHIVAKHERRPQVLELIQRMHHVARTSPPSAEQTYATTVFMRE
jgi:DNA-binding transcriptional LysR family regulator